MQDTLTQKQETFTLNLLKGMSQRVAWREAGFSCKYSPAVIDVRACEMARKVKVRLAELRAKVETDAVANKREIMKWHTKLLRAIYDHLCGDNPQAYKANQIKAAAELAKLGGYYAQPEAGIVIQDIKILVVRETPKEIKDGQDGQVDRGRQ